VTAKQKLTIMHGREEEAEGRMPRDRRDLEPQDGAFEEWRVDNWKKGKRYESVLPETETKRESSTIGKGKGGPVSIGEWLGKKG